MRRLLNSWLTRWPAFYLLIERIRPDAHWDKRVYLSFVRPGDVVLDVGANIGRYTLLFSDLVGRSGKVLSFEPVPASFGALNAAVEQRARCQNVSTFRVAIGNPSGPNQTVMISVPGGDLEQASLKVHAAGTWGRQPAIVEHSVPLRKLDDEAAVRESASIHFVKVDVEGGELDVLKGASETLRRHRPLLYCELYAKWTAAFGYSPAELVSFVRSLGYTDARVLSDGAVHRLELGSPMPDAWFDESSDVLFFSPSHAPLVADFDRRFPSAILRAELLTTLSGQ